MKKNKFFFLGTSALDNSDGNIEKVFNYIAKNIDNTNMIIEGSGKTLKESMRR